MSTPEQAQAELFAAAREMYAAAVFERDNDVRRVEDPLFDGSTWDREWGALQVANQDLYYAEADRDFQSGVPRYSALRPLLDAWRWQVAS